MCRFYESKIRYFMWDSYDFMCRFLWFYVLIMNSNKRKNGNKAATKSNKGLNESNMVWCCYLLCLTKRRRTRIELVRNSRNSQPKSPSKQLNKHEPKPYSKPGITTIKTPSNTRSRYPHACLISNRKRTKKECSRIVLSEGF